MTTIKKQIYGLPAGTIFALDHKPEDKYVISSDELLDNEDDPTDDITNGFIKIRPIHVSASRGKSWIGDEQACHADIKVLVNPAHLAQ